VSARRICWPNPDATCLQGGCLYCNDHPFVNLNVIHRWAQTAGTVRHRGSFIPVDARVALTTGLENDFYNADVRR